MSPLYRLPLPETAKQRDQRIRERIKEAAGRQTEQIYSDRVKDNRDTRKRTDGIIWDVMVTSIYREAKLVCLLASARRL